MSKNKTETLSFRVEPCIKDALRIAAGHEHRSLANMVEVMVLEFCARHRIAIPDRAAQKSDL
jgi:hypothetical protein